MHCAQRFAENLPTGAVATATLDSRDARGVDVLVLEDGAVIARLVHPGEHLTDDATQGIPLLATHPVVELYRDPAGAPLTLDRLGAYMFHGSVDMVLRWEASGQDWASEFMERAHERERLSQWLTTRTGLRGL